VGQTVLLDTKHSRRDYKYLETGEISYCGTTCFKNFPYWSAYKTQLPLTFVPEKEYNKY
jgi:hypothetical protein